MVDRKSSWETSHQGAESRDAGLVRGQRADAVAQARSSPVSWTAISTPSWPHEGKGRHARIWDVGTWPVAFWKAHVELCRDDTYFRSRRGDRRDPTALLLQPEEEQGGPGSWQLTARQCGTLWGTGGERAARTSLGTGDTRGRNVGTEKTLILRCTCVGEGPGREPEF